MNEYLAKNKFLADINNEYKFKNAEYQKRLESLDKFVMYAFEFDDTIVPFESTWFGWENKTMEETTGYQENWIGLRTLDEQEKIERRMIRGMKHVMHALMQIPQVFRRTFQLVLLKMSWFNGWAPPIPKSLPRQQGHLKYFPCLKLSH